MARIAVFDSGLGSLSLVAPLRRAVRAEIIYLADQRSYPYGKLRVAQLRDAVRSSIDVLRERFDPDVIVVGSNTPSLLVPKLLRGSVVGVLPPIRAAARVSKTRRIAVMATRSVVRSRALQRHATAQIGRMHCQVMRIDASALIHLAETARFVTQRTHCTRIVRNALGNTFARNLIDAATLSSTHLPLLRPVLEDVFPHVTFVDPAPDIAARVARLAVPQSSRARLRVYATGSTRALARRLARMGFYYKVSKL